MFSPYLKFLKNDYSKASAKRNYATVEGNFAVKKLIFSILDTFY